MIHKKRTRETYQGTGKTGYRLALMPAMLMAAMRCANTAWAVDGGVVAAGAGAIKTQGNKTTISQSSDKMIVNWKNFNIGQDQSVVVSQPGATSALLNRVTTADPTQINGVLKANGRVFVVNPAGVVFGQNAKVNVGSLVASTLDVNDQQFMDGGRQGLNGTRNINLFSRGGEGKVTNNGQLTADEAVILLGPQAANYGTIRARDVTLGAANGVAMQMSDSGFGVSLGRQAQNALAANYGVIAAKGGNVTLSAAATGAMLGTVVRNTGQIEATSASLGRGGSITLGAERDGKIGVGGRLTADNSIWITTAPAFPSPSSPFDASSAPDGSARALKGHDIAVESGAKIQAASGYVNISSARGNVTMDGKIVSDLADITAAGGAVTTNGRIEADQVSLGGVAVDINAPIHAGSMVSVSGDGDVHQRADVSATTGSVYVAGANIIQANGVKTSAAADVSLTSKAVYQDPVTTVMSPAGQIHVANVTGKTININGGDIALTGNLKADGNISVKSMQYMPPCPDGMSCVQVMQGGHLVQTGNVISRNGNVALNAATTVSQQASSLTKAGNDVTLNAFDVQTGRIQAGDKIAVDAYVARVGGKLTAREVSLPANTQNADGNIRIKAKSANL
ncbi:filamentous hemagglutinin family protein [Paraburkholderia sp. BL6665CI2N2]|uniref:filamentous hemagglutinin N-terminal domain-containing protein n=1 Tax=Paraburkholderia sp. BL6665CI2N2 TaxID=1938806 RepID=UPI001066BFB8|nr:filamentous hemagglutinin N-terminal domain-containing protein [Paraburkholderia sp. BL6665CI2N2]TDY20284.1 filamentous hemagglutinin family protein [Paraburkholderia sp. BL6665CI2N2]